MPKRARRLRIAAYAWAANNGSVLLARIAPGELASGRWTLPGGGVEFGEHPDDALHRELYEETGLTGTIDGVVGIDSRHHQNDRRAGLEEAHLIRIVYRVITSGEPRVVEVDGSTDAAAWIPLDEVPRLPHVSLVDFALEATR